MRKISAIVMIITVVALLLSSCEIQQNWENTVGNNATKQPNGSEIISPDTSVKTTEETNEGKKHSQSSALKPAMISMLEIKQFLNSKKSDILKAAGSQIENGTISVMESHMLFPFIFAKDLGLTFVFPNETDDISPIYVVVNKETNFNDVNIKGAKPGMNFMDIRDRIGDGQVVKTWFSNEDNIAYKLDYVVDGMVYSFVSYDEQGQESQLYITLGEN